MSKKPDPELIDDDNPEWTESEIRSARRFDLMPAEFQATTCGARPAKDAHQATGRASTVDESAQSLLRPKT
jgi:hypothetical protein